MYKEEKKGFIEELQSLEEPTKRKILIVATAIAMAVVIYFWLAYFNSIVANISRPTAAQNQAAAGQLTVSQPLAGGPAVAAGPAVPSPGILERTLNGTASLYQHFMGAMQSLGNILQAPRQYIIRPPK